MDLPHRGDAYDRTCPCRQIPHLVGDKWTVLVVDTLADGPKRFGALRRRLDGISQKVLTHTLRELERDGLVSRTVHPLPLAVAYALTPLGATTVGLLEAVREWAETHLPEIEAARAGYDEWTAKSTEMSPMSTAYALTNNPPSTGSSAPVTQAASSEAR